MVVVMLKRELFAARSISRGEKKKKKKVNKIVLKIDAHNLHVVIHPNGVDFCFWHFYCTESTNNHSWRGLDWKRMCDPSDSIHYCRGIDSGREGERRFVRSSTCVFLSAALCVDREVPLSLETTTRLKSKW